MLFRFFFVLFKEARVCFLFDSFNYIQNPIFKWLDTDFLVLYVRNEKKIMLFTEYTSIYKK